MEQWIERGFNYLIGPNGGLLAMAMGAGAGLYHRFVLPSRIKPLEERIEHLEERAAKYDQLMEDLAKGRLAKLEDHA